jgi:polysaccharide biosynthesis protein PslH
MAMGVPVVTSPEAAGGVDAVPGEHLLVARSPDEYADTLLTLMTDSALRQRFAAAGRARIETHHSWTNSMAGLDRIVKTCIESHWGSETRHTRKAAGRP